MNHMELLQVGQQPQLTSNPTLPVLIPGFFLVRNFNQMVQVAVRYFLLSVPTEEPPKLLVDLFGIGVFPKNRGTPKTPQNDHF